MAALVDVVGLTKRYGSKRGVIDLSFQIAEGEVFGFLGPNGAGKTTTMRLLMSLLFPDSGSARIAMAREGLRRCATSIRCCYL